MKISRKSVLKNKKALVCLNVKYLVKINRSIN